MLLMLKDYKLIRVSGASAMVFKINSGWPINFYEGVNDYKQVHVLIV